LNHFLVFSYHGPKLSVVIYSQSPVPKPGSSIHYLVIKLSNEYPVLYLDPIK